MDIRVSGHQVETGAAQHALQLAPNFAFDGGVVGGQHVGTADAVLFLAWASGAVGKVQY